MAPLPHLPQRPADSHKGDFGRVLIVGGSRGMTGAAALAGRAALRGGAGLVTVATPDVCLDVVAGFDPCYTTLPLPSRDGCIAAASRESLAEMAERFTVFAVGPGLGRAADVRDVVLWLYQSLRLPMVLDADALNALAQPSESLQHAAGPRVITPHLGEFQRLVHDKLSMRQAQQRAVELAAEHQIIVLLKGHRTLITDGVSTHANETGNPGMATGGTGDVLTGLIAGLIAQKMAPFAAARLGAHLHGLAADLAATDLGEVSLVATDLVDYLPRAIAALVRYAGA